jgi:hypothetical protein
VNGTQNFLNPLGLDLAVAVIFTNDST